MVVFLSQQIVIISYKIKKKINKNRLNKVHQIQIIKKRLAHLFQKILKRQINLKLDNKL